MRLDNKLDLITDSEKNPKISQTDLSLKYDIGKATVCVILRRKDEHQRQFEENIGSKRKRHVSVNFLIWIMFSRCLVIFRSRRPRWWNSSQWTRSMFMIKWPVYFTWWYRGIWRQFDNGINFSMMIGNQTCFGNLFEIPFRRNRLTMKLTVKMRLTQKLFRYLVQKWIMRTWWKCWQA